jgi:hypothetical protein
MAKVFFKSLPAAAYAHLCGKRIKQSGRIVVWEITREAGQQIDPFWLVMVRRYKEKIDRPRLAEITGSERGNGTERFVSKEQALARFEQLASHPGYLAEAKKEEKRRAASSLRLRKRHAKGEVTKPCNAPSSMNIGENSVLQQNNGVQEHNGAGLLVQASDGTEKRPLDAPVDRDLAQFHELPLLTDS